MIKENKTPLQALSKSVAGMTSLPDALTRLERGEIVQVDAGDGMFEIMAVGQNLRFLYLPKNKPGQAYYTHAMKPAVGSDVPEGKLKMVEEVATAFTISVVEDQLKLEFIPSENRAASPKTFHEKFKVRQNALPQESAPQSKKGPKV